MEEQELTRQQELAEQAEQAAPQDQQALPETPLSYPRRVELYLTLSLEVPTPEQDQYLFAEPGRSGVLQIGFLADLFDLFNEEASLGVLRINGSTHEQVKKTLYGNQNL